MSRNKKAMWIIGMSLVFLVTSSTFANCGKCGKDKYKSTSMKEAAATQSVLYKSKELMGCDVKSMVIEPDQKKLETIGKVEELIMDRDNNKIQYVVVKSGGDNYPVPWSAFETGGGLPYTTEFNSASTNQVAVSRATNLEQKPTLYLNMTKDQFRHAPMVKHITMANLSDPGLREKADIFYSQNFYRQGSIPTSRANTYSWGQNKVNFVKTSDITGLKVENTANKDLGRIKDLVIDSSSGQVTYGLISFGGKTAAVPWNAITALPQENIARIDTTKQTLEATVLKKGEIVQLTEPDFARMVHNFYGAQPYWETMAFVPGEEIQMSLSPWQWHSRYNKNFDPGRMTTIEGTITNVGTFYPEKGALPGTELTVKTRLGQTVTVQAGPLFHALQQDIQLGRGNEIKVTGSQTMVNGKPVIMASELEVEGKTLKLRDDEGKPLWNVQQFEEKMKRSNREMNR